MRTSIFFFTLRYRFRVDRDSTRLDAAVTSDFDVNKSGIPSGFTLLVVYVAASDKIGSDRFFRGAVDRRYSALFARSLFHNSLGRLCEPAANCIASTLHYPRAETWKK